MSQYLYVLYILWALRHTFGIQLILPLENQKPKHTTQPEQCEGGRATIDIGLFGTCVKYPRGEVKKRAVPGELCGRFVPLQLARYGDVWFFLQLGLILRGEDAEIKIRGLEKKGYIMISYRTSVPSLSIL
ncbi:uncharacterized protein H6S33_002951 [Morchella sextelata]|uniref:uncharacterized protein n=1 Tax=Morchella sextelata TaxID=1174677 RepID=UPI001D03F339|nr:uncharacterized protein H6S33_002951 [Morchella sextelata]KAH0606963.1 hypothetical protein H6S33_002951 [Morchella sextelata]